MSPFPNALCQSEVLPARMAALLHIGPVGPKESLSQRTGPGTLWVAVEVRVSDGKQRR
jgi:hypothetical protein